MLACVDLDHGPASCYWVGHFIAPELVVRAPFVEVAWVALLRFAPGIERVRPRDYNGRRSQ